MNIASVSNVIKIKDVKIQKAMKIAEEMVNDVGLENIEATKEGKYVCIKFLNPSIKSQALEYLNKKSIKYTNWVAPEK